VNSKDRNFNEPKLRLLLKRIHENIERDLQELDQHDTLESPVKRPTADELKDKMTQLQARRQHDETLLQQLEATGASQISLTDPDSRSMKTRHGIEVCYNLQVAGDHQRKLLVEHEVTNEVTDQDQLATMATRAKAILEADHLDALADMGYDNGDEVKQGLEPGIVPYIQKPNPAANSQWGLFGKEDCTDDPEHDCDACPAGQLLPCRFETVEQGRQIRYYSTSACQGCPCKSQCTRHTGNRRIPRWVHDHLMEDMPQRVLMHPEKVKWRKSLVEHPFGTIKRWMDHGYCLPRGLAKVRGAMSLTILVYH